MSRSAISSSIKYPSFLQCDKRTQDVDACLLVFIYLNYNLYARMSRPATPLVTWIVFIPNYAGCQCLPLIFSILLQDLKPAVPQFSEALCCIRDDYTGSCPALTFRKGVMTHPLSWNHGSRDPPDINTQYSRECVHPTFSTLVGSINVTRMSRPVVLVFCFKHLSHDGFII